MERTAIVIGILVAICFAAAGAGVLRLDGMNMSLFGFAAPQVPVARGRLEPAVYAANAVRISDAAAVVRIIPEDRADIALEVDNPGRAPMPLVRAASGRLELDGRLQGRILNCRPDGGVDLLGYGGLALADLPVITLRTPKAVDMTAGGALQTDVGEAASAKLSLSGCGLTTLSTLSGALDLNSSGSGDLRAGSVGSAEIDVAGSGDVALGGVGGDLDIEISGNGNADIASLTGSFEGQINGSGDIAIGMPDVTPATPTTSPMSQTAAVPARGVIPVVDVEINGSGDISVSGAAISQADVAIHGSGGVTLDGDVGVLEAELAGSGQVTVNGTVRDLDAAIYGSGNVRARAVTGQNRQRIRGSGEVIVGP